MARQRPARRLTALAAIALALPCAAWAARPFTTDDAGVLDAAGCEWETVAARATFDGAPKTDALTAQLACGIGWRTQLAAAYGRSRSAGESVDAFAVAGKTGLADGGDDAASLAISYAANWLQDSDASFRIDSFVANLIATRPLGGGFVGHANLGWLRIKSSGLQRTTWNLAVERPLGGNVDAGLEAYGDDVAEPLLGLGARWTPTEAFSFNVAYAAQFGGERARVLSAGIKIAF